VLRKLENQIQWSPAAATYMKRKNMALKGVSEVTVYILDLAAMIFRHDPLVGVVIFYLAIKSQTLNR